MSEIRQKLSVDRETDKYAEDLHFKVRREDLKF